MKHLFHERLLLNSFQHRNFVMSIGKLYREYSLSARIVHTKLDCTCDFISTFKIKYTIDFNGISVR